MKSEERVHQRIGTSVRDIRLLQMQPPETHIDRGANRSQKIYNADYQGRGWDPRLEHRAQRHQAAEHSHEQLKRAFAGGLWIRQGNVVRRENDQHGRNPGLQSSRAHFGRCEVRQGRGYLEPRLHSVRNILQKDPVRQHNINLSPLQNVQPLFLITLTVFLLEITASVQLSVS